MKVLSVVVAIAIWIIVANINDPVISKHFTDIPVRVVNEKALTDNGYAYEILEGNIVSFTIKGKKSIVYNMTTMDFDVVADFSKLSLTDAVPIDVSSKKYSDQLEISLGNTNTMKIKKDEIISVSLPVNVYTSGSVAEGFYVGTTLATPNLIKVNGPENLLKHAREIRAEVETEGINKDITTVVKPKLYDDKGQVIESTQIDLDESSINVFIKLWKLKTVKVNLSFDGEPEEGYLLASFDYEPKTVRVAADEEIYDDLESLDLVSVDLEGLNNNYEKDIPISSDSFPDGVILAEPLNSIKVNAKIEKIIDRKMVFSKKDIDVKNGSGYHVEYDSNNRYNIDINGGNTLVKKMTINDFDPWIDLSGLEEGEHTVKIHVKKVKGITVEDVSSIVVHLTRD